MPLHYYIDTDYLHSYVFFKNPSLKSSLSKKTKDEDESRYTNFKDILFNKNKEISIIIPFIVCGEFFNNIHRNYNNLTDMAIHDINNEIYSLLSHNNVDLKPPKKECYHIANKILNQSNEFDPTDTLIVSQALNDKHSKFIATLDNAITNSLGDGFLFELNKELCDKGERLEQLRIYD